ncbi:MAG: acyl-[acyl-carrier-protein]--UDP-N-acetylglucosamine O-acyltransferase [Flavobacteriia bacterium]|nr:MAG: acyl-[acyl-carrier-protein]--UDP-N-acetylglucosamine O-acyltransferase [Flavobacteriia bacterium]
MNQPLAYVHPGAKIATNVVIEPFTTIHNNVTIGEGTWIGSNVTIMGGARIGKNCKIFPGAVISAIPQDLKFDNEDSEVIIGDHTTIREFVTINRGTKAYGRTEIGNHCLIMATAHVAHDCIIKDHVIIVNGVTLAGHVEIGEYAIIGGLAGVHQFIHIGKHAMISGGSLVRKDVPPYVKAAKEPLSYIGINSIGLRRRGFDPKKINEIQNIYRILFQRNNNTTQAMRILEAELDATTERDEVITFIRESQRGIMKGYTSNF